MTKLTVAEFIAAHPKLKTIVNYDAIQRVARWVARGRITQNPDGTIDLSQLDKELAALPVEPRVVGQEELVSVIANLQAQIIAKDKRITELEERLQSAQEEPETPKHKKK